VAAAIVASRKPGLTAAEQRLLGFLAVEKKLTTRLRESIARTKPKRPTPSDVDQTHAPA
jgi:hypothetical protein